MNCTAKMTTIHKVLFNGTFSEFKIQIAKAFVGDYHKELKEKYEKLQRTT